jgi:undecaprenyl-diphosphatase
MEWLWGFDQQAQQAINVGMRSEFADNFFRFATWLGHDFMVVPLLAVLILIPRSRRCGWQCFVAYAIAGLSALLIKLQIPRFRPGYPSDATYVAPDEQIFLNSFPSGHAAITFAIAFTVLFAWPGKSRLSLGLFGLAVATVVGISRVYRGVHWPTDVLGSIALAWLAALAAQKLFSRGQAKESTHPSAGPA